MRCSMIAWVAILLIACSGGQDRVEGDSGSDSSDDTPPQILSLTPGNVPTISPYTSFHIRFSERMSTDPADLEIETNTGRSFGSIYWGITSEYENGILRLWTEWPTVPHWGGDVDGDMASLRVTAKDVAGNVVQTGELTYELDFSIPGVSTNLPSGSTIGGQQPIVLTFTEPVEIIGVGGGLSCCRWDPNRLANFFATEYVLTPGAQSAWAEGPQILLFQFSDMAGSLVEESLQYTVDLNTPIVSSAASQE